MRNFDFVGIKEFVYFPSSVIEYTKSLIMQPTYIIWFLYATFFCDLFIFLQNKIVRKNNNIIKICASIIIEIILIVLPQQYFGINIISYYFPIFCFGYYISIYFDKIKQYIKYIVLPSLIFYIYLFQYYNFGYSISIINYSIALFGIIILYYLVSIIKCKKIINFFQYFGKKSLEFYLCQCVCLNIGIGSGKLRVVSIFISAMIVSNFLVYITNKFKISRMILYGKFEDKGGTKK